MKYQDVKDRCTVKVEWSIYSADMGHIVCPKYLSARFMKCTCSRISIDKDEVLGGQGQCTVRWSVVVQCRYWETLYVLEYLIGARYMKCTCPGLTIGKMKYQYVMDRCTVRWSVVVQCRYWETLYVL